MDVVTEPWACENGNKKVKFLRENSRKENAWKIIYD